MSINNVNSINLYNSSNQAVANGNKATAATTNSETVPYKANGVTVDISTEAIFKSEASQEIDVFLKENGGSVYQKSILSLKTQETLSASLDDDSLPSEERLKISKELTSREYNSFVKYAKQSPPDFEMYYKKFVEYYDSLSPEDQKSERYSGLREKAVIEYKRYANENGSQEEDLSFIQDPILSLFDAIKEIDYNVSDPSSFKQTFLSNISYLFDREDTGPTFKAEAKHALSRFDAVQTVIEQARAGDKSAFSALESLVNGSDEIETFLNYADSLT